MTRTLFFFFSHVCIPAPRILTPRGKGSTLHYKSTDECRSTAPGHMKARWVGEFKVLYQFNCPVELHEDAEYEQRKRNMSVRTPMGPRQVFKKGNKRGAV